MNGIRILERRNILLAIIVVAFAITLPLWFGRFYIQLSTRALFLSIVTMSFILLSGYGGMTSLAQMSFFAMAGYIIGIGWKSYDAPYELLIPLAVIGATLLSAAFALIAIRASGIYFLVMTLALGQLFQGVALQWASVTGGYNGIAGIEPPVLPWGLSLRDPIVLYYVVLITIIVCYVALRRLVNSPFGIALQGIRDNPQRMSAMGFNVQRHRFLVIVLSGVFAGIAGVIGVFFNGVIAPDTADLEAAVLVLMAALVGGITRLEGGILGAVVTVFLVNIASGLTLRYWSIVGVIFVLIVLFLPNGLLGSRQPGLAPFKRWRGRIFRTERT